MSKKIVFVGPPGVGKTTLRKIFFEYQSADQLMQFALDPTYGAESVILNRGEHVGIFDLAGQENQKWLNSEESSVFFDTTYIIAVIDSTESIESIMDFTSTIVRVRDDKCPRSTIFLLAHKIDLLSPEELEKKKHDLYGKLKRYKLMKIELTSIIRPYFLRTLKVFKNILNATLDKEIPIESIDDTGVKEYVAVLRELNASKTRSAGDLALSVGLTEEKIAEILHILIERKIVSRDAASGSRFSLAPGLDPAWLEHIETSGPPALVPATSNDVQGKTDMPPFMGFLVADITGRSLLAVESRKGILSNTLGMEDESHFDLIPPFISALTSFSKEIRLVNMADFKIKGHNALMYVFEYEQYDLIMFLHPDTNIDSFKPEIQEFFINLITTHSRTLQDALGTGNVAQLSAVHTEAENWLFQLGERYELTAKDVEIFDMIRAQQIYASLDEIALGLGKGKASLENEIRGLKRKLITAIMEKDLPAVKEVARVTNRLRA